MRRSIVLLCALLAGLASASEIYKWTDKNGRTHYSDRPPPAEYDAERRDLPREAGAEAESQVDQDAAAAAAAAAAQRCADARDRLQTLRDNAIVAMDLDGDGTAEPLDAVQREEQILEAQRAAERLCVESPGAGRAP